MAPTFNEFEDERALAEEVQSRISQGTSKDNLYVLSHDDDRTERVADKTEASVPDELEGSIAAQYNKKGDELRAILHDFGFSKQESSDLEEKLDRGRILLVDTGN